MVNCVGVVNEPVRATVKLGGLIIKTPYVKSFSVDKSRDRLASTFSVNVEILINSAFVPGADIEIYSGSRGHEKKRFTGMVKTITTQSSFDKAGYVILSISGTDRFGVLEGRTFSRRLRSEGFASFVSLTGGPSNRPSRGASIDKRIRGGSHQTTSTTPNPARDKSDDHTELTRKKDRGVDKKGAAQKIGEGSGTDSSANSALTIHDHSGMANKGGPAFGVFSAD
jgi:hypothetical protein